MSVGFLLYPKNWPTPYFHPIYSQFKWAFPNYDSAIDVLHILNTLGMLNIHSFGVHRPCRERSYWGYQGSELLHVLST